MGCKLKIPARQKSVISSGIQFLGTRGGKGNCLGPYDADLHSIAECSKGSFTGGNLQWQVEVLRPVVGLCHSTQIKDLTGSARERENLLALPHGADGSLKISNEAFGAVVRWIKPPNPFPPEVVKIGPQVTWFSSECQG